MSSYLRVMAHNWIELDLEDSLARAMLSHSSHWAMTSAMLGRFVLAEALPDDPGTSPLQGKTIRFRDPLKIAAIGQAEDCVIGLLRFRQPVSNGRVRLTFTVGG